MRTDWILGILREELLFFFSFQRDYAARLGTRVCQSNIALPTFPFLRMKKRKRKIRIFEIPHFLNNFHVRELLF